MKIKVDYVTNSSSEVFGVVAGNSAVAAALITMIAALFKGCQVEADNNSIREPQAQEVTADAGEVAQQIAKAAVEDAKQQEEIIKDAYNEASNTLDDAKTALERELDECKKTWEESEKTADKTDPGYENLKNQYGEYMDYLKNQIEKTEYQKQMVEYEKAQNQAEIDSKSEWVRQQQQDYIAVKEERAMIDAVRKGYGNKPGYNTDAVWERQQQLEARERELERILSENDASIDYTARDRGEIGPSKESLELTDKIRKEREAFEKAAKKASAEKRAELEAEMEKNIAIYQEQISKANRYDMATKAAEGIQYGADIAVDGLSYVTGPAGKQIKLAYKAGKSIASGMGEGMADPKNASKHLAKGILNAGTEVLKDKFGDDKPWQAAATGILNEGLQSGLDASIKGENVVDAMGKGLTKGVFDAGTDKALDVLKGKLPIQKGTSVDASDLSVSQVLNNNPLRTGLAKISAREMAVDKAKNTIKDAIIDKAGKAGGFSDPG